MRKTKNILELWLDQHGGRVLSDLEHDKRGFFVYMWSGVNHVYYPFYLPKEFQ